MLSSHLSWLFSIAPPQLHPLSNLLCLALWPRRLNPANPITQVPCPPWLQVGQEKRAVRYFLLCFLCSAGSFNSDYDPRPLTHGCWLQSSLLIATAASHPSAFKPVNGWEWLPCCCSQNVTPSLADFLNFAHFSLNTFILSLQGILSPSYRMFVLFTSFHGLRSGSARKRFCTSIRSFRT